MGVQVGSLVGLCRTIDQAKATLTFAEAISEKSLRSTVALTAGRGRGKSAALGIAIAAAIGYVHFPHFAWIFLFAFLWGGREFVWLDDRVLWLCSCTHACCERRYGYANIFVTSPSPENLNTLFEFVFKVCRSPCGPDCFITAQDGSSVAHLVGG